MKKDNKKRLLDIGAWKELIYLFLADTIVIAILGKLAKMAASIQITAMGRICLYVSSVLLYVILSRNGEESQEEASNEEKSSPSPSTKNDENAIQEDEEGEEEASNDNYEEETTGNEGLLNQEDYIRLEEECKREIGALLKKNPEKAMDVQNPNALFDWLKGKNNNEDFRIKNHNKWVSTLEELRKKEKIGNNPSKGWAIGVVAITATMVLLSLLNGKMSFLLPTYVLCSLTVLKRALDCYFPTNGKEGSVWNAIVEHEYFFLKMLWFVQGIVIPLTTSTFLFILSLVAHLVILTRLGKNGNYNVVRNVCHEEDVYIQIFPMIGGILPNLSKKINVKKVDDALLIEEQERILGKGANKTDMSRVVDRDIDYKSNLLMELCHIYCLTFKIKESKKNGSEIRTIRVLLDNEEETKHLSELLSSLAAARASEVNTQVNH